MKAQFRKLGRSIPFHWLPVLILVLHASLGVLYSVSTPLWESFDEWGHYPYVEYVAEEHKLPREPLTERNDETNQPPLYYILGALATFWIDTDNDLQLQENEFSVHRGGQGGVSFYLHLEDERFPYRGTTLAAHVTRLVSVLLSTVSVWATYLTSRDLFPSRKGLALAAMSVGAFWPQLLFLGSVINNDIMVTASSSFVLLFLVRVLVQEPRPLNLLGLGLSLGAALLSKRNGLALVPFVLIGLVVAAAEQNRGRKKALIFLGGALLVSAGAGLVSFWWFGDLREMYQGHITRILSLFAHPASLIQLRWQRLPNGLFFCLATFFASFGHLLLGVEAWIYRIVALLCLTAGLGLAAFLVDKSSSRRKRLGVVVLILHVLAVLAAPVYRTLIQEGEPVGPTVVGSIQSGSPLLFSESVFLLQGRFVLPAISSFSVLLVLGLSNLAPQRLQNRLLASLGLVLLAFSVLVPFRYIRPAYAKPRQLPLSRLQRDMENPLNIVFGEKIELLGYRLASKEIVSGGTVPVTLYWRCLREMERNYHLTMEVLGPDARVYGTLRLHPGQGNFPTSLWEAGESFRETYRIPIDGEVPTPSRAYLKISVQTGGKVKDELTASAADGREISATFGDLVVRAGKQPQIDRTALYRFDEKAALVGYEIIPSLEPKDHLEITLYWQALAEMKKDYTVFVHVLDGNGNLVAQEDSQPNNGLSPTSVWEEEEIIEDRYVVRLDPSAGQDHYTVHVGLYDLATMIRVPAFDADGSRLRHDVVVLKEGERSGWRPDPGQPALVGPHSSLRRSRAVIVVPGESPENPLGGLT